MDQKKDQYCYIAEQGDMGLFGDPLNEADNNKVIKEQSKNEDKKDEE